MRRRQVLVCGPSVADPDRQSGSRRTADLIEFLLEDGWFVTFAGSDAGRERYVRALRQEGVRTQVVVDVIAGTSAGGINGICLAKALAHNLSQEALRDLWFERGDIDGLLAAPRFLPRALKVGWVAMRGLKHAPLRGELMAQWIYEAFGKMDKKGPEPGTLLSLLPDRHRLELFVTVTDFYGYGRQVPYADPNPI